MLSLFSGIGGIDLAAQWAGIETVAFCEIDKYCQKVLQKHWPRVPIFEDIRTLNKEVLEGAGISGIDIVAGGYPCQPFSTAGKRRGKEDDRYLWPEMFRIIFELRPPWVIGENVAGHVTLGLDNVLSDLESIEYATQSFIIPACSVNAPHRRYRVLSVAGNTNGGHRNKRTIKEMASWENTESTRICADVADSQSERCTKTRQDSERPTERITGSGSISDSQSRRFERKITEWSKTRGFSGSNWWATEPDVGRVANGVPNRVDRLKCLGNAVVPQQIYPIFAAIAEIERGMAE